MAQARREMEGDAVAALVMLLPVAFLDPKKLPRDLNPFKEQKRESEAMKAHKAKLAAMRFKALAGGK